jgi:hypothetical protein
VPENGCKLVFAIEKSQDAPTDEDLATRERDGALEAWIRVEVEMVGQVTGRVSSDTVAHDLQVLLNILDLRGWREPAVLLKALGKDTADTSLLGVGNSRIGGKAVRCAQNQSNRELELHVRSIALTRAQSDFSLERLPPRYWITENAPDCASATDISSICRGGICRSGMGFP